MLHRCGVEKTHGEEKMIVEKRIEHRWNYVEVTLVVPIEEYNKIMKKVSKIEREQKKNFELLLREELK